jgi:hypothetical protein
MIDRTAGPCGFLGTRHRWEKKAFTISRGITTTRTGHRCRDCKRVRVTEYTRSGNHIAGYFSE